MQGSTSRLSRLVRFQLGLAILGNAALPPIAQAGQVQALPLQAVGDVQTLADTRGASTSSPDPRLEPPNSATTLIDNTSAVGQPVASVQVNSLPASTLTSPNSSQQRARASKPRPSGGHGHLIRSNAAAPTSPALLLVDDDDNAPDVRSSYTAALDGLGVAYDIWDTENTDSEPDAATLAAYSQMIWFTGAAGGAGVAGPGPDGEAALSAFLDAGKSLLISSQDYYYDRSQTDFMTNYLGLGSDAGEPAQGEQTTFTGAGSIFSGLGPYATSYAFTNYSDILAPGAGAEVAFAGNQGTAAINKDSGVYRTAYFGFPMEAISTTNGRQAVLSRFLSWASGSAPTIALNETAGTDPAVCATTPAVTVATGATVTFCSTVTNTGPLPVTRHSLADTVSGPIMADYAYILPPGGSMAITHTAQLNETTANTATWTAVGGRSQSVSSSRTATVTVQSAIAGLAASNSSPIEIGQPTVFTATVTAGDSVSYAWTFGDGATATGAMVNHTYAAEGSYTATVTATNLVSSATATTSVTVHGPPGSSVTPASLDFGLVQVGSTASQSLQVANTGTGNLVVASVAANDPSLEVTPTNFTVAPGAAQTVTVTYAPGGPGTLSATITLNTNDPNTPVVTIPASGEAPTIGVNPAAIDETLHAGLTRTLTLTLTNHGASDLDWTLSAVESGGMAPGKPGQGDKPLREASHETRPSRLLFARRTPTTCKRRPVPALRISPSARDGSMARW